MKTCLPDTKRKAELGYNCHGHAAPGLGKYYTVQREFSVALSYQDGTQANDKRPMKAIHVTGFKTQIAIAAIQNVSARETLLVPLPYHEFLFAELHSEDFTQNLRRLAHHAFILSYSPFFSLSSCSVVPIYSLCDALSIHVTFARR